jgi:2-polyprenyl-3-methyl-5-hydroxy-6-metoxy-1,4-benzoquinol methylase
MTAQQDSLWNGDYKIPWHEPDFSRRMLAEHLSQHHDLASRRTGWIEKQVEWIHTRLLDKQPTRILDLGCGPGFYSNRLAMLGHRCCGIDFGPASIEYARQHCPAGSQCEFVLDDLRRAAFGGPYDLAMLLYGEVNVFSPPEISAIFRKVQASLAPRGRLILEAHTPQAVERIGRAEPSEQQLESGLFSDCPHRCRTENQWLPEQQAAIQTFSVTETRGGPTRTYRNTTKAWSDDELIELLTKAGFHEMTRCEAWPRNTDDLVLWVTELK